MKRILIFLTLTLILSQLFLQSPFQYLYGSGDNYEFLAFQTLVKENISLGHLPLAHTNTLRYPVGFDLSYGYDGAMAVFTGAFLNLVTTPVFAYNLTIFIILFLNLYISYLFFRRLSSAWPPAFIATLIFAASPFVLTRLEAHLNLAFIAGFPLLGLAYLKLKESPSFKNLLLLQLSFFIIATGSLQHLILLAYNLIVLFPLAYFLFPRLRPQIPQIGHFIFSCLVFLPLYLIFFGGYLQAIFTHQLFIIDKSASYLQFDQPWLIDLLVPNRFYNQFLAIFNPSPSSIEKIATPGFIGLGLLIYFFLSTTITSTTKKFLAIVLTIFVIIALGLIQLPLYPEGSREIIILTFILAIITAIYLQVHQKILYLLISLLLFERLLFQPQFSQPISASAATAISSLPGTAALNIPTSKYSAYYSSLPAFTHKKTVDGYFHFTADNPSSNQFLNQNDLIQRFICQPEKSLPENYQITSSDLSYIYTLLKSNDIKTIIVHKNGKYYFNECLNTRNWWTQISPPTIVLSATTPNLVTKTTEIIGQPKFIFRFYAQKSGTFTLHGTLFNPDYLNNLQITTSYGLTQPLALITNPTGAVNEIIPVYSGYINAGDSLTLASSIFPIKETIYATFYYTFEATPDSISIPLQFSPVYSDDKVEVYRLN